MEYYYYLKTFKVVVTITMLEAGMSIIEVSEEVYKLLLMLARERGKSVEEIIVDMLVEKLDPKARIEVYMKLHEKYLREGEELRRKGDLVQAGEKLWGATTSLLNAIAEERGWPHYSHRDYAEIIERLLEETGDETLPRLFASAERLHANFYHNFLSEKGFNVHAEDAKTLVKKLIEIIQRRGHQER